MQEVDDFLPCNYSVPFSAQASGNLFGDDPLTGGPSGILQPMNKPHTEVDQTQNSVNKGDLDTSLNKVVQSIGEYYQVRYLVTGSNVPYSLTVPSLKQCLYILACILYPIL